MKIYILRTYFSNQTLGDASIREDDGKTMLFFFRTLELPDAQNKRRISCIPEGVYQCKKNKSTAKFKYPHVDILNVPNRAGIKIHIGNFTKQIKGCILVGDTFTDMDDDDLQDVTNSANTLKKFMDFVPEKFEIEIKESCS